MRDFWNLIIVVSSNKKTEKAVFVSRKIFINEHSFDKLNILLWDFLLLLFLSFVLVKEPVEL